KTLCMSSPGVASSSSSVILPVILPSALLSLSCFALFLFPAWKLHTHTHTHTHTPNEGFPLQLCLSPRCLHLGSERGSFCSSHTRDFRIMNHTKLALCAASSWFFFFDAFRCGMRTCQIG